ncbi:MAG: OmpH family outer membrane protein [Saprospirales bacterium]|nr:MAG: OmpH family outer membrane protein [Saprospirales bacterium]
MKNMFKIFVFSLLMFGMSQTNELFAQKIGHLNSAAILSEMPEVLAADAELETLQKQLVAQAQRRIESLQKDYQELIRQEQQGDLSPRRLQEEQMRLREKEQELAMEEQNIQSTLMRKRNELINPILERVQDAIDEVARENNFQYILDTSGGSVLFADDTKDITRMVRTKLGIN